MEKVENQEVEKQGSTDPRKVKYSVHIKRDTHLMKIFFQFKNRVEHPRASMNLFIVGALLIMLPNITDGLNAISTAISYVMGGLIVIMALFRQYLSVWLMKNNPEVKADEEITYLFGTRSVRAEKNGAEELMGYYRNIHRIWEDEKHYYIGINVDDLLVLPKANFQEGDAKEFRDFILDKSGADFVWKPSGIVNICKDKMFKMRTKMSQVPGVDPEGKK